MPDERLLHKRAAHSDKVSGLTDMEFRVWVTYLLNADDYGVMRFSTAALEAGCDALEHRKGLKSAFQRLVDVKLLRVFEHQGKMFVYQPDWQDYQSIRYPRLSVLPSPPEDMLRECSDAQQRLFALKQRNVAEKLRQSSRNSPEDSPVPVRAGGRETLTANANADPEESPRETTTPQQPLVGPMKPWNRWQGQRLEVPQKWHDDAIKKLGGPDASERLLRWYPTLDTRLMRSQTPVQNWFKWLDTCFTSWLSVADSGVPDVEETRRRIAALQNRA